MQAHALLAPERERLVAGGIIVPASSIRIAPLFSRLRGLSAVGYLLPQLAEE
jgi:hypothetical protein